MHHLINRRDFLKTGAGLAGASLLPNCFKAGADFGGRSKLEKKVNEYSMAFLLVVKDMGDLKELMPKSDFYLPFELDSERTFSGRFERMKKNFSFSFLMATNGMSGMNTDYPTYVIVADKEILNDNGFVIPQKVVKRFYNENPDDFDFLSIYSSFEKNLNPKSLNLRNNLRPYHKFVKNNIQALGISIFDYSSYFGTKNLKSFNVMKNAKNIYLEFISGCPYTYLLLHETGHTWGVGNMGGSFGTGGKLEITDGKSHFYHGLESSYESFTPMGAHHWVLNNDGTFRLGDEFHVQRRYHLFLLYAMGLVDESEYNKKCMIYDAGNYRKPNFNSAVPYKEVCINDIIGVVGPRKEIERPVDYNHKRILVSDVFR